MNHRQRPLSCLQTPIVLVALLSGLATWASGEDSYTTVPLWESDVPLADGDSPDDKPYLWWFPAATETTAAAVLICPGGGYARRAAQHEGIEIAEWLNQHGVHAAVCHYRVRGAGANGRGYGHPVPLLDAQRGMRTLRARAGEWKVDPRRVGVLGFSAGGHLASTVSTKFDAGDPKAADPVDRCNCRPDFSILCYPVIAFDKPFAHRGSQVNLLGSDADPQLVASLSNETQVTAQTPPTFLFHTDGDQAVPPENSVEYYLALRRHGVPAELHIFASGEHGVGLGKDLAGTRAWSGLCIEWLRGRGIVAQP